MFPWTLRSWTGSLAGVVGIAGVALGQGCPAPHAPVVLDQLPTPDITLRSTGYSIDADGTNIAVADADALRPISATGTVQGSVMFWGRTPTGWRVEGVVRADQLSTLGYSVAIRDGWAAVPYIGYYGVYIYRRQVDPSTGEGSWTLDTNLLTPPRILSVHIDAGTFYLAGPESGGPVGNHFWTLTRTSTGQWVQQRIITGETLSGYWTDSSWTVQGDVLALGYPGNSIAPVTSPDYPGRVRVYRRGSNGVWALEATLRGRNPTAFDGFGAHVALDGDTLAVGANWEPSSLAGYAQVFRRSASTGQWELEQDFSYPGLSTGRTDFGIGIALHGNTLVIGAPRDRGAGPSSGVLYVYQRDGNGWHGAGSYMLPASAGALLGWNVRMSGTDVVGAAIGYNGYGAVGVFDACSISTGGPIGATPRCLPGIFGLLTFLNAWFDSDPFADFNHSGHLDVQDIFDYLGAWMAGCP